MESVENKIIYLKICKNSVAEKHCLSKGSSGRTRGLSWTHAFGRQSTFWRDILYPAFCVETKEFRWLGYDIVAFVIYADVQAGISDRDSGRSLKKRMTAKRFRRTIETISRRISESGWERARLLCNGAETTFGEEIGGSGAEPVFPEEMLYRYFGDATRAYGKNKGMAEQLILIAPDTEEESASEYLEEALLLSYRLYPEYNYMTILTDQPAVFEPVMEEAAEESGLYIRCMEKEKNVLFPDKRTAILDLDRELAPCYRHFPGGAVYVTPWDSVEKKRRLQAKCPQIACFSMLNALDTVLHNTV